MIFIYITKPKRVFTEFLLDFFLGKEILDERDRDLSLHMESVMINSLEGFHFLSPNGTVRFRTLEI